MPISRNPIVSTEMSFSDRSPALLRGVCSRRVGCTCVRIGRLRKFVHDLGFRRRVGKFGRAKQLQVDECHEPFSTRTDKELRGREFQRHGARGCTPDGWLERAALRGRDDGQRICTHVSPELTCNNGFDRRLHDREQCALSLQQLGVVPRGARRISRRSGYVEQCCGDDCGVGTVLCIEERYERCRE